MPEINKIEVHSEEVQELMGFIPKGVIRWGLTVIFLILLGILIGSYFFKSPEIINAPMVLTTKNPPVELLSKSTGKIDSLFFKDGQFVNEHQIVALINNTTNFNSFQNLEKVISNLSETVKWDKLVMETELEDFSDLGELQPIYSSLFKNYNHFKSYLTQNLIPKKIKLLEQQISKQNEYSQIILKQKAIQLDDLGLSEKAYSRDSVLYVSHAISESEFEKSKQILLTKKSTLIGLESTLKNIESSVLQIQQNCIELGMQYQKDLEQYRLDLDETKLNISNQIHQWKEKYLISAPINGKVTYTSVWSENQEIKVGELIATIIPQNEDIIVAKAIIPTAGFGRVAIGQLVNIKLAGFPYMQFGMLKGRISTISLVPEEEGYIAEIELIEGMTSSYRENLKFIQKMDGTAEIITEDMRMIYRFINPLRALLDKGL